MAEKHFVFSEALLFTGGDQPKELVLTEVKLPGLRTNIFEREVRELVQFIEDEGHGSMSNDRALHTMLANKIAQLLEKVSLFYHLPRMSVSYDTAYNVLSFMAHMTPESRDFIEQQEPLLFAALISGSTGKCVCQAIDGIRHTHEEDQL